MARTLTTTEPRLVVCKRTHEYPESHVPCSFEYVEALAQDGSLVAQVIRCVVHETGVMDDEHWSDIMWDVREWSALG